MLKSNKIDVICIVVFIVGFFVSALFINAEKLGIQHAYKEPQYKTKLFDPTMCMKLILLLMIGMLF